MRVELDRPNACLAVLCMSYLIKPCQGCRTLSKSSLSGSQKTALLFSSGAEMVMVCNSVDMYGDTFAAHMMADLDECNATVV